MSRLQLFTLGRSSQLQLHALTAQMTRSPHVQAGAVFVCDGGGSRCTRHEVRSFVASTKVCRHSTFDLIDLVCDETPLVSQLVAQVMSSTTSQASDEESLLELDGKAKRFAPPCRRQSASLPTSIADGKAVDACRQLRRKAEQTQYLRARCSQADGMRPRAVLTLHTPRHKSQFDR